MRHIIPISGKDSLATALVQIARAPNLPYEYVFNPTGAELPEVFEWIDKVENYLGKSIVRCGADLKEIIAGYNYFLPSGNARYCTKEAKILPFIEWISGDDCMVYYGIRADEQREGFNNTLSPNIIPVYPLRELNMGLKHVYHVIGSAGLKPPTFFWESVYNEVCRILGFDVRPLISEALFDMLFAWRSRANCYFCFNQRLYELVGLLEHHPDLFDEAESYEHKGGEMPYYWKSGYPMAKIKEMAPKIKRKRVYAIIKTIIPQFQTELFEEEINEDFLDVLQVKSCGLFCGK